MRPGPSGKAFDPADILDVAEHRLDRVGSLGVERSFGRKPVLHDPSAGSLEHTSARGFATALVSLVHHGDEEVGSLLLCNRQVGVAVVAGVGKGLADALRDVGGG